jgi:parvulin-like peptidyl-prolyl isomerase
MKKTLLALGLPVVCSFLWNQPVWGQAAPAAPPKPAAVKAEAETSGDAVVLTIGTEKITRNEFERIMQQALPPDQRGASLTPAGRRAIAEQLAELKALAQEARKEKLDQTADAKTQISMRVDQFVAGLLYRQLQEKVKPDNAAVQAYYDAHKNDYESVTARHILIRMKGSAVPLKDGQKDLTDDEALAKAQDLRKKIQGGASFEDLAKAESDDGGSGANGGALGDFGRGRMVPQFEEAAFKLPVNEVSEPVKTQFGYHIIQVQKHETKPLAEVENEINQKLAPEMTQKGVDEVKAKTSISFDTTYFGK